MIERKWIIINTAYTHIYIYIYIHVQYRAIRDTSVEDREQEDNTSAREHSYRKLVAIVSSSIVFFFLSERVYVY